VQCCCKISNNLRRFYRLGVSQTGRQDSGSAKFTNAVTIKAFCATDRIVQVFVVNSFKMMRDANSFI